MVVLKLIGILALCVAAMVLLGWLLDEDGYLGYISGRSGPMYLNDGYDKPFKHKKKKHKK